MGARAKLRQTIWHSWSNGHLVAEFRPSAAPIAAFGATGTDVHSSNMSAYDLPPVSSKWYASEEAMYEMEGLEEYVHALTQHDLTENTIV